jgi:hypothetical protein
LVLRCVSSPPSPLTGRGLFHRDEQRDQVSGLILLFMLRPTWRFVWEKRH